MARRMDRQGELLIWCRKCSGYARQRMGPKLMNHCQPEKVGTKDVSCFDVHVVVVFAPIDVQVCHGRPQPKSSAPTTTAGRAPYLAAKSCGSSPISANRC